MALFGPGTLLITDDSALKTVAVVSFPAGTATFLGTLFQNQTGAVLRDGTLGLTADTLQGGVFTVVQDFEIVATDLSILHVTNPFASLNWYWFSPVASDFISTFYVSRVDRTASVNVQVAQVTSAGVVGGTIWTMPVTHMRGLTVNAANTILTYGNGIVGGALKQFDIIGNTSLPDLVPGATTNLWGLDLVTLSDGTIVTSYQPDTAQDMWAIRAYTPLGALRWSVTLPQFAGSADEIRVSLDVANQTRIYVRSFEDEQNPPFTTNRVRYMDGLTGVVIQQGLIPSPGGAGTIPASCPLFGWSGPAVRPGRPGCGG